MWQLAELKHKTIAFERLKGLRKSANLKYRLEEEKRLDELAQDTCRNFIKNRIFRINPQRNSCLLLHCFTCTYYWDRRHCKRNL